ncbi:MAG: alpha/beta hydrolase [Rhodospirillales bacterium]|nr:alpha/beta hydrolase [Rhodospirillales bacterium]
MTVAPRERHYRSQDDLRLFFRDWGDPGGDDVPVLCLPGLTRHSNDFDALARHLATRGRRVICPDLRGRGRSAYAADWRTYEPRTYLDDIRHLLAALGIGRVIVVGTSMGGLLGAAFPTALAGLALNDVGPDIGAGGAKRILDYVSVDRPQPDWPTAAKHLQTLLPNLSLSTKDEWLTLTRNTFREGPDGRLHFDWDVNIVRPMREGAADVFDLWALWRAVRRIPVLAIRGGASDILSADTFARMKAEKPDLVQVTLPGVGHAPTLNEPPAREAIDEFLRRF